jgi:predicted anti-sigma-YlaC factor YlaD
MTKHLSDEEIQAYLGRDATETDRADNHLKECPSCGRILEEYRSLYGALADEECFAPSIELAARALSKVRIKEVKKPFREYTETLAAALGIALALVVAVWAYVGLGGQSPDVGPAFEVLGRYLSPALQPLVSLTNTVASVRNEFGFVVMAGFVLYVILSLDYLFLSFPVRKKVIT